MFILKIGHSHSKHFPKVVELLTARGAVMEKGFYILTIPDYEMMSAYKELLDIFLLIGRWKNVHAFYRGKEVNPFRFIFSVWDRVVNCAQDKNETWDNRHCWVDNDNEEWGCKLLLPFALNNYGDGHYEKSNRFWYNFGEYKNDLWHINKKLIFEKLINYADKKGLTLCPFFEKDKLRRIVEKLPDNIVIDNIHFRAKKNIHGEVVNIRHIPKKESAFETLLSSIPIYCSN